MREHKSIGFIVPGKPQGKARHRTVRAGRGLRTYTPSKTKNYEHLCIVCFKQAVCDLRGVWPTDKKYDVFIRAFYQIPKSWSKKKKQEAMEGKLIPTVKPDLDNIAKIICDALNGFAWEDDKQVISLEIDKKYSSTPNAEGCVKVCISALERS